MKDAIILSLVLALLAGPARAAEPEKKEVDAEQVRAAIDKGTKYLRNSQIQKADGTGHWEHDLVVADRFQGGETALTLLALMTAGVKPDDPVVKRGLEYLRKHVPEPSETYVVGLVTMAYAEANQPQDLVRIQRTVKWLVDARIMKGQDLVGWGYRKADGRSGDNSNTQYALLGLHAGKVAGAEVKDEVWKSIRDFYIRSQQKDGGWIYSENVPGTRLTMTTAGLCGLVIAGLDLNEGRETIQANGIAQNCGVYAENKPVADALGWIGKDRNFNIELDRAVFYNLYGIERAGRLSGERFFGKRDWYREGCDYLVKAQKEDGSFAGGNLHDRWVTVSTSFALLFLGKGRTPILISKLVHGPWDDPGTDWNSDRHDARNLVDFASKKLFNKSPLAWQVFNTRMANKDDPKELAAELLQSPILYITGHKKPVLRDREKEMLKAYVEGGGFVLGEACCGSKEFAAGFRALMKEIFPDHDFAPLPASHTIWSAQFLVPPDRFPLEGIELGCRTCAVLSTKDLSCHWESNKHEEKGDTLLAFRLGGNIIAYATGLQLPKDKGTKVAAGADKGEATAPRNYIKLAQINHGGDRHATPQAVRNLMAHLRDNSGMDVALRAEELEPGHASLVNFKFMYMHGRGNFEVKEFGPLKKNLKTGGTLLADACCGNDAFDKAFRAFVEKLFQEENDKKQNLKLEPIPADDPLYGKEVNNGTPVEKVRCRRESGKGSEYTEMQPYLEGIKLNGRWVVIYSKYDLGCALEKHQSPDCRGYDYPSALKLASAALLYALQR